MTMPFECGGNQISLIILAGGKSRRMERQKALLPVGKGTLIEHILLQVKNRFDEIIISAADTESFQFLPFRIIPDKKPSLGPLTGLQSALKASNNEENFVLACDIPEINLPFMQEIISQAKGRDAVIPVHPDGKIEPLFAVYSKRILPKIKIQLKSKDLSLRSLLEKIHPVYIRMNDPSWLVNLNTEKDYLEYLINLEN